MRRVFNEYLDGKTISQIAKGLEDSKIVRVKVLKRKKGVVREKLHWDESSVKYMLQNERYTGDAINQKSYKLDVLSKVKKNLNDGTVKMFFIESNHAGIISKEQFTAVQAEFARRKEEGCLDNFSSKYAFSRKLVCGNCGETYIQGHYYSEKKGEKHRVDIWQCKTRAKSSKKCKAPKFKEKELEDAFLMMLHEILCERETLLNGIKASVADAIKASGNFDADEIHSALKAKQAEMLELSKTASSDMRMSELMNEIDLLNNQLDICHQAGTNILAMQYRVDEVTGVLEREDALEKFNSDIFKAIVDRCEINENIMTAKFKCGIELTQEL